MSELLNYTKLEQSVDEGLVWSDKNQSFKDLPPEIWNFHIESYQICKNWLKTRKDRPLNNEDTQCYQRIVMILKEIVELMEEIQTEIQREQLKKRKIFEKVRDIVADKLGIKPVQVTFLANFTNDLGANSLNMVELLVALEQAFSIEIPDKVAKAFLTVQQVISYISQKIEVTV